MHKSTHDVPPLFHDKNLSYDKKENQLDRLFLYDMFKERIEDIQTLLKHLYEGSRSSQTRRNGRNYRLHDVRENPRAEPTGHSAVAGVFPDGSRQLTARIRCKKRRPRTKKLQKVLAENRYSFVFKKNESRYE